MAASWRTFTHAARHCSSVPYCCSNSTSVSPCMIARIAPIPRSPESILHRFRGGRKGGDWLISGFYNRIELSQNLRLLQIHSQLNTPRDGDCLGLFANHRLLSDLCFLFCYLKAQVLASCPHSCA